MEHLEEWDCNGRVVFVHLHNITIHVPPALGYLVNSVSVLTGLLRAALLIREQYVRILIPEDAVIANTSLLYLLCQLRPYSAVPAFILFLASWLEEHLKCKSFHISLVFQWVRVLEQGNHTMTFTQAYCQVTASS